MTEVHQPRGVDSDRVDSGRRPWRTLAAGVVLGAVLGGALGGYYGASRPASYQANTALSVLPDSAVLADPSQNSTSTDATSFIQSQLVVLNSNRLSDQVRAQLKLKSDPSLSSTQVGQSYVIQVNASAGTKAQALVVARTAASVYANQRIKQLRDSINASIKATDTQAKAVGAALKAATPANQNTNPTPTQNALQTQLQQLGTSKTQLSVALAQTSRVVTTLSPAALSAGGLSATAKYLATGAVLGALLLVSLLIVARRTISRVRGVGDIAALGVPVLLPVQPRRRVGRRRGPGAWRSSAGRLLAARLTGHQAGSAILPAGLSGPEPIILVGASSGVGTSFTAATVAAALTERGQVLLVLASELLYGSSCRQLRTTPARSSVRLTAEYGADVDDLIRRALPSSVPGVWVLPCDAENADLVHVAPSRRAAVIGDLLQRASAAGWLTVVDTPALSDSDLAVDLASSFGVAALVVGRSTSRPADVLSAAELFDAHDSRLVGAVLNDVPRRMLPHRHHAPRITAAERHDSYVPVRSEPRPAVVPVAEPAVSMLFDGGIEDTATFAPVYEASANGALTHAQGAEYIDDEQYSFQPAVPRSGGGRRRAPSSSLRHGARDSR